MTNREPAAEDPMIGEESTATPWAQARERLERAEKNRNYWLATVRPEGRPHVMPLIGLWLDDLFYFISSDASRKGMNLASNPHCVLTLGSSALPALDLVIEGEAVKVSDDATLRRVVDAYGSVMEWPLEVSDGGVIGPNAPTAGPPPYSVFELTPTTIFGLPGLTGMDELEKRGKDPISPTRWRF